MYKKCFAQRKKGNEFLIHLWDDEGYQDYQYVRCRVQDSKNHQQLIGADVLINALEVAVFYEEKTEPAGELERV